LHWTILGATAVGISYGVVYHFAIALLPLLGVVLPALVVALILRPVFTGLAGPVPVPSRPPEPATPCPSALPDRYLVLISTAPDPDPCDGARPCGAAMRPRPARTRTSSGPLQKGNPSCSLVDLF